jgi:hypothetical protein
VDVLEEILVAQHLVRELVVHRRVEVARHQQRRRVEREAAGTHAIRNERSDDLGDVAPHGHDVRAASSDVFDPFNATFMPNAPMRAAYARVVAANTPALWCRRRAGGAV